MQEIIELSMDLAPVVATGMSVLALCKLIAHRRANLGFEEMIDPLANINKKVDAIIHDLPPGIKVFVMRFQIFTVYADIRLYNTQLLYNPQRLSWEYGPSRIYDSYVEYTNQHGSLHRGRHLPAVIRDDGSAEFWQNGKQYWPFDAAMDEEPGCA